MQPCALPPPARLPLSPKYVMSPRGKPNLRSRTWNRGDIQQYEQATGEICSIEQSLLLSISLSCHVGLLCLSGVVVAVYSETSIAQLPYDMNCWQMLALGVQHSGSSSTVRSEALAKMEFIIISGETRWVYSADYPRPICLIQYLYMYSIRHALSFSEEHSICSIVSV